MRKMNSVMRGLIAASALAMVTTPAFAGDEERALAAIAQAQGKIDAAMRMKNGTTTSPETLAKAQASLRLAREEYKSGKEQKAIESAVEAQQYADTVIGETNQTADLNAQAQAETTAAAQQEAANANARAAEAEQSAANSAAVARAATTAANTPKTTITTETVKNGKKATKVVQQTTTVSNP